MPTSLLGCVAILISGAALTATATATAGSQAADSRLERGRYLVEGIAACANCHAPRDDRGTPMRERGLVGGSVWRLPTATVRAPNITPDRETGIGAWTDEQIGRAIREGVRPDGSILGVMPIAMYRGIADDDLAAIVAYLRAQTAQTNAVARSEYRGDQPPAYGPPIVEVNIAPPREDLVPWGEYLAGPLGHCMSCHTPRLSNGRPDLSEVGAGGNRYPGVWGVSVSRNLTPHESGLKGWSDTDIERAIRDGLRPDGSTLKPPMDFAAYRNIDEHDMRALVAYLRSLEARPFGGSKAAGG